MQTTSTCLRTAVAALGLGLAAGAAIAAGVGDDDPLAAPFGQTLAATLAARGVQIYECRPAAGGGGRHEWAFVAPEADLYDARGRLVGRHGAGPYWQADDGSRIVGSVTARADAPTPGAIPWLLLATRSTGAAGAFSAIASVQRIRTVGGIAPAGGCSVDDAGRQARMPYRADYLFFVNR